MSGPRQLVRAAFGALEGLCSRAFTPAWNPLLQLGAVGWFFYWIVAVSGIYLYIFFDTGITQAFDSVEALTRAQPWAGGVLRSLHRYASDGLVLVALVHLGREFALDRMRGKRWFAWVTGLPLLLLIYASGITGYWLVWDVLSQYVAQTTAALLDVLPIFGEPISRNFANQAALSSRFFTLMSFLHIAAPLLLLLFMWIHIQRHAGARIQPARGLAVLVLGSLIALAIMAPATSQPRADLDRVPATVGLDWFYLPAYPIVQKWGGVATWQVLGGSLLLLLLFPWLPRQRVPPVAQVSLPDCNGCGRCVADCPFGAISLEPRSDGAGYAAEAVVHAERCVSCGICVGACPTGTPFRTAPDFRAGIELPQLPLSTLRDEVASAAVALAGNDRLVIFACPHTDCLDEALRANAVIARLPCIGMLPPPFIDFVFARKLADGIVLAGCAANACRERLGQRWTEERIAGLRDPWLRARVPRPRIAASWLVDLAAFRRGLAGQPAFPVAVDKPQGDALQGARPRWPLALRAGGIALVLGILAGTTALLASALPWRQLGPDEAVLRLSIRHVTPPKVACKPLTPEQMLQLKPNMRRPVDCPRERWPLYVELERDGRLLYHATQEPSGLWNDGAAAVHRAFRVAAGRQAIVVRMRDSGRTSGYDQVRAGTVELEPGQNFVIEFETAGGFQWH